MLGDPLLALLLGDLLLALAARQLLRLCHVLLEHFDRADHRADLVPAFGTLDRHRQIISRAAGVITSAMPRIGTSTLLTKIQEPTPQTISESSDGTQDDQFRPN